jgi:hypothetical protein
VPPIQIARSGRDGVAVVGNFFESGWARIAGVHVVAVVDPEQAFNLARTDLAPPAPGT